jgi:uncharacterized protein YpbB
VSLGQWHNLNIANGYSPTKNEDIKDDFHNELECIFDKLCKYHKKYLVRDFNAKEGTFSKQI